MEGRTPDGACLHELIEAQARRTPEAPAVEDAGVYLTYAELDRSADALAAHLRGLGLRPDALAGVYMERSADFVVACLAILKAGGAYLPLELAYPPKLLAEVVADSGPRVVLTRERYAERLPRGQSLFCMDEGWESGLDAGSPWDGPRVDRENLAFVSYSSGTTGKPKGIANPHRAAVLSYLWRFGVSDYAPGDRVGCNVFFIWEMLRPLLRGATTVVIPDGVIYHPAALIRFLEGRAVTEVLVTPSLLEAVLDANADGPKLGERLPALRTLWLNGEVVTRTLARRARGALPETRLLNVYSCSETHEVAAGDLAELMRNPHSTYCPVGLPMDPETTYILDENGRPLPDGEAGELFVGGGCLARGYVNLPEKTEESFPPDPFSGEEGARMYRSGDKARMLPDGSLEILGRTDFMVKIRGYSVELGAVEAAIEKNVAVRASVVVAEGGEGEDKRLVAYLVPSPEPEREERYSGWEIDPRTGRSPGLRRRLQDSLPHYAIPAVFVETASLPLQATSGKVDRNELPPPPPRPRAAASGPVGSVPDDAPRAEKEAVLARVWEEVLRLESGDVRPDDDFFDLGGHSLAAAQLSGRVEETFGVHVTMPDFLENPTVAGLCDRIEALRRGEANGGSPSARSAVDLRAEAVLEPEISPESAAAAATTLGDARNVFLTGATGFLGAFLLDGLLSRTDARVHCLVRPRNGTDPAVAIRENLRRYGLSPDAGDRVVPVAGDLGAPLLGLSREGFDGLASGVDAVIHAGAAVNLIYPYEAIKAPNVGGTREVLRLACRHRAKPLHHVSTNGIFPPNHGLCEEDADLDSLADAREDGYGRSKWVAEALVRRAAERGLPVRVYRPGNISGHSESGASNPRDLTGALLVETLRRGRAPEADDWRLEMTPVDFVVAAILHLADRPDTVGRTFHLADPDPVPAASVFDWLEELGYPLERLPYAEWARASRDASRDAPRNTSRRNGEDVFGGVLGGVGEAEIRDTNTYDDRNTRRYLGDGGPVRPRPDGALFERYARYFAGRGWAEGPKAPSGGGRASA